jgi:hypothetical protein
MTVRLTEDRVREIYNLLAANHLTHQQVANLFHISRVTVSYINNLNRRYRHLAPQNWTPCRLKPSGERNGFAKLCADEVRAIYKLAWAGAHTLREIAEKFDVSLSQIWLIKHKREWRHLQLDELDNNEERAMTEDELKAELDKLKKRQTELETKLGEDKPPLPQFKPEPYQPRDYTAGATMDAETKRELAKAFPADLVRDLRSDAFKPNPVTGASQAQLTPDRIGQDRGRAQVEIRGTGWQPERKIEPPPGVGIMDRMLDAQDAIDKAEAEWRRKRLTEGK